MTRISRSSRMATLIWAAATCSRSRTDSAKRTRRRRSIRNARWQFVMEIEKFGNRSVNSAAGLGGSRFGVFDAPVIHGRQRFRQAVFDAAYLGDRQTTFVELPVEQSP